MVSKGVNEKVSRKKGVSKKQGHTKVIKLVNPKKKRFQSIKDYLHKLNKGCCTYCGDKVKLKDISLIMKNHTWDSLFEPLHNKVVACRVCARKKGCMNHDEYKDYLRMERKKLRKEISKNYSAFAKNVFHKYDHKCIYCEFEYGFTPDNRRLTIDHKKPLIKMGSNHRKNLASSCYDHNNEKSTMKPDEYFSWLEKHGRKHTLTEKRLYSRA